MTIYNLGAGIADITDPAIGTQLQGMADPSQVTRGVETSLYSRTFIIEDIPSEKIVALVTADLWSATEPIKTEVLKRLQLSHPNRFEEMNLLICGTHTHSGPGGYSTSRLYEETGGGFDLHTFDCIVSGIVTSIENSLANLAPGKIYINKGEIEDCGRQRSRPAYDQNPTTERSRYSRDTDNEMLLLKFVTIDNNREVPMGVLSWYAIHPTDRGQENHLISGDNKGFASFLFEQEQGTDYRARETFVAAFANSNCGDVSGNVEFGEIPNGVDDKVHMELHGRQQFEMAKTLFDTATEEIDGEIDFRFTYRNMSSIRLTDDSHARTWPAALGISFAAGSKEDSIPRLKVGPLVMDSINLEEGLRNENLTAAQKGIKTAISVVLSNKFGGGNEDHIFIEGHHPKPIICSPGLSDPPTTPAVVPLQLIKIGNLGIVGVPGELTTMAGRRLRESLLNILRGARVNHLALSTYANEYTQYITTEEEYAAQHYEGASTLFGPHTLKAYQQEFRKIAQALADGDSIDIDPPLAVSTTETASRVTFRNRSNRTIKLELFNDSDSFMLSSLKSFDLESGTEWRYIIPSEKKEIKARIDKSNQHIVRKIAAGDLVVVSSDGTGSIVAYTPPFLPVEDRSTIRAMSQHL